MRHCLQLPLLLRASLLHTSTALSAVKEKLYTVVRAAGESYLSKQDGSSWGRNFCDLPAFGTGTPASLPH